MSDIKPAPPPEESVHVKPHGCMYPFHPFQIASYFLFFFYAYVFYFIDLVAWADTPGLAYSFAIPYSMLFIGIAVVAIIATLSDPTDPTVYEEKRKKTNKYGLGMLSGF